MKRSIFSLPRIALLFVTVISLTYIGCKDDLVYDYPVPNRSEEAPILLGKWVQLPEIGDPNQDIYLNFLPGGEGELTNPNSIAKCANGEGNQRSFLWVSYLETDVPSVKMSIYREIICGDTVATDAAEVHPYKIDNDTLFLMYHNWVRK